MTKFLFALAAAGTLASAMVPAIAQDVAPEGAMATKAGGPTASMDPPPAGMGQIVFYRTSSMVGGALGCQVTEFGERISALGRGKYFVLNTTPGPHSYTVSSEAKDVLNVEVEPGETQYVRCKIKMGIMAGRPNISPSTKDEYSEYQADLEPVDADDMGPKRKG